MTGSERDTRPGGPPDGKVYGRVPLPGSRVLSIRSMQATDSSGLVALYAGLNEDDLYCRFFTAHAPPEQFVETMARVEERGGFGMVAITEEADGTSHLVGEATCQPLPNGDGELGITVAEQARGWLGPYLLDTLLQEAAARGVPNVEADVLLLNRRMLSLLRSRGFATIEHSEQPTIARVLIGTTSRVPGWPGAHERPRLLVEVPGGHWHAEQAARTAGFQIVTCPGPGGPWSHCPARRGEPCPLVAGADVVVDAVPAEAGTSLLEAHRRAHPTVPVCVQVPAGTHDAEGAEGAEAFLPQGADDALVMGILQRMAAWPPAGHPQGDPAG